MSAKKSWDVQPSKKTARPAPRIERASELTIIARPGRKPESKKGSRLTLKNRRRKIRQRVVALILVLLGVCVVSTVYFAWRPALRISAVEATGPDAELVAQIAKTALQGTYAFVFPRNSVFFLPEELIREKVLASDPEISSISIVHNGFTGITINALPRVVAFWWCGTAVPASQENSVCYESDPQGFLFAQAQAPNTDNQATSTEATSVSNQSQAVQGTSTPARFVPMNSSVLLVYAPLDATSTSASFVGSKVAHADKIPDILQFAHSLDSLNVDVKTIALRDDEVDLYLKSGTRITYVLGDEAAAGNRAAAAFSQINLNDGSVDYVDLRFDGKVYVKNTATSGN